MYDYILGLTVGTFFWTILAVTYDIYLGHKLRRVRFEVAQLTFKYQDPKRNYRRFARFAGAPRFLLSTLEDQTINKGEPFLYFERNTLYSRILGDFLLRILTVMASPIIFISFVVNSAFLGINKIHTSLSNSIVIHNVYIRRKSQFHDMYLNWYTDKKDRLKTGKAQIQDYLDKAREIKEEHDNKIKIVGSLKTQGVDFNKYKELI